MDEASVARCCRAFGVLDLIFDRVFFQERDRWRVLRRAEAGVVSRGERELKWLVL